MYICIPNATSVSLPVHTVTEQAIRSNDPLLALVAWRRSLSTEFVDGIGLHCYGFESLLQRALPFEARTNDFAVDLLIIIIVD